MKLAIFSLKGSQRIRNMNRSLPFESAYKICSRLGGTIPLPRNAKDIEEFYFKAGN